MKAINNQPQCNSDGAPKHNGNVPDSQDRDALADNAFAEFDFGEGVKVDGITYDSEQEVRDALYAHRPLQQGNVAESEGDADEIIVKLADGCTLRSGADDPDAEGALTAGDYVRLCGPDGEEIHYWSKDEWQADPALVMGAIMIATAGNRLQPSVEIGDSRSAGN